MRRELVAIVVLAAGCAAPSGQPASGFITRDVEAAYIPLEASSWIFFQGDAAAVVLGDGIAVTNAHTANLVDDKTIIGQSTDYDLLFFRTTRPARALPTDAPRVGERVVAYGQDSHGTLRRADGVVAALDAPVKPECDTCKLQSAFTFVGNAGPGFSGGPVLDAASGRLIGIIFGYTDNRDGRTIYAYPIARVLTELANVQRQRDPD
ncbi:MAG: trypsin-like peptidase domain-containing protein [Alphaproteobacteria bacterium]|nr:trypsin-like peptidase domain-containing protein [Alphaproteobacteria bacterium]